MSSFLFQIHLLKLSAHQLFFLFDGVFYLGALRKQCQERRSEGPSNGLENSWEDISGKLIYIAMCCTAASRV